MAETYKAILAISVVRESNNEVITSEEYLFNGQTFARMANIADEFYATVEKLQKIK